MYVSINVGRKGWKSTAFHFPLLQPLIHPYLKPLMFMKAWTRWLPETLGLNPSPCHQMDLCLLLPNSSLPCFNLYIDNWAASHYWVGIFNKLQSVQLSILFYSPPSNSDDSTDINILKFSLHRGGESRKSPCIPGCGEGGGGGSDKIHESFYAS